MHIKNMLVVLLVTNGSLMAGGGSMTCAEALKRLKEASDSVKPAVGRVQEALKLRKDIKPLHTTIAEQWKQDRQAKVTAQDEVLVLSYESEAQKITKQYEQSKRSSFQALVDNIDYASGGPSGLNDMEEFGRRLMAAGLATGSFTKWYKPDGSSVSAEQTANGPLMTFKSAEAEREAEAERKKDSTRK